MRALPILSILFVVLAACGGENPTNPDASGGDDDPDAMSIVPDAAPVPPDAEPNSTDPAVVCVVLCGTIQQCFGGGGGPDEECVTFCNKDLADCTTEQVGTLAECADVGCRGLIDCVTAVECIDDGGKGSECGDGTCDPDEDCGTCAEDCGACVCGDSVCNLGECASCETDCPGGCVCPHDTCTVGEVLDPGCDSCVGQVCDVDSYCCETEWDGICVQQANSICGKECEIATPPDGGVPEVDAGLPGVDAGAPPSPPALQRRGFGGSW
jgi:hypothetical protein